MHHQPYEVQHHRVQSDIYQLMHTVLGFGNVCIIQFCTFHLFGSFLLKTFQEIEESAMD